MTNDLTATGEDYAAIMERVLIAGDLSRLTPAERTSFYMQTCKSLDLNPLTTPFEYIRLNGKDQLYAKKSCTDQLRAKRRLSVNVKDQSIDADMLTVTVSVRDPSGREDEDFGCVFIRGLSGEALANARMKAITKAKRRATLSFCGLGVLDETEIEDATFTVVPNQDKPKRVTSDPLAKPITQTLDEAVAQSSTQLYNDAHPITPRTTAQTPEAAPSSAPQPPVANPPTGGAPSPSQAAPLDLPFVTLTGEVKSCTSRPMFLSMMEAAFEAGEPAEALDCFFANQTTLNEMQSLAFDRHEKASAKGKADARAVLDRVNAVFETAKDLQKALKSAEVG